MYWFFFKVLNHPLGKPAYKIHQISDKKINKFAYSKKNIPSKQETLNL